MFYYLGRKKRIAKLYPEPVHDIIIEPFAGSAAYSLHGDRWKKQVIINDLNKDVISVWRYLKQATAADIKNLPDCKPGDRLSDIQTLSDEERWLISFHINPGANQRSDVVTKFSRWSAGKNYISKNLHKISHWKILSGEYYHLSNQPATWFVDPPYFKSGKFYMTNTVDFSHLRAWCLERKGQLIVCEQSGADWLEFGPLIILDICGKNKTKEMVFTRETV
jgi:16S rRNA G966 N2-methylase RsmD